MYTSTSRKTPYRANNSFEIHRPYGFLHSNHPTNSRKLYFGDSYSIKEHLKYSRYFFKHHWDPEKTVDESLMKTYLESNWNQITFRH